MRVVFPLVLCAPPQILESVPSIRHEVKFIHYAQSSHVKSMKDSSVSYASAIVTTDRK